MHQVAALAVSNFPVCAGFYQQGAGVRGEASPEPTSEKLWSI